jgi:hypothetical protein
MRKRSFNATFTIGRRQHQIHAPILICGLCDLWKAYWEALTLSGYEQGYKDGWKASQAQENCEENPESEDRPRDMESPQDGTNGPMGPKP